MVPHERSSCGWGPTEAGYFIRKEFRLLLVRLCGGLLHRPYPGFHAHREIEGGLTKGTSQYVPGLCQGMANMVCEGVRKIQMQDAEKFVASSGSERAAINELLMRAPWRLEKTWAWKSASHINLLEGRTKAGPHLSQDPAGQRFLRLPLDTPRGKRCRQAARLPPPEGLR